MADSEFYSALQENITTVSANIKWKTAKIIRNTIENKLYLKENKTRMLNDLKNYHTNIKKSLYNPAEILIVEILRDKEEIKQRKNYFSLQFLWSKTQYNLIIFKNR